MATLFARICEIVKLTICINPNAYTAQVNIGLSRMAMTTIQDLTISATIHQ
jgi:hypothetical protein